MSFSSEWQEKKNGENGDYIYAEDVNLLADGIKENTKAIETAVSELQESMQSADSALSNTLKNYTDQMADEALTEANKYTDDSVAAIPAASETTDGKMSAADKKKLDGVSAGANKVTVPNEGAGTITVDGTTKTVTYSKAEIDEKVSSVLSDSKSYADTVAEEKAEEKSKEALTEAGQTFANAFRQTLTGAAVSAGDVSPVSHEVSVRVSGVSAPEEGTVLCSGRNLLDVPYELTVTSYMQLSLPVVAKAGVPYTVYMDSAVTDGSYLNVVFCLLDGENTRVYTKNAAESCIITPATDTKEVYIFASGYSMDSGVTTTISGLRLYAPGAGIEEYEAYIEPVSYPVLSDGSVPGVKSISPGMTLTATAEGATLECTYNCDSNTVKDVCNELSAQVQLITGKVFNESPRTWTDVQNIVRNGLASRYFDIGDQFVVEKLSEVTANIGESTGITAVSVNSDTFISGAGEVKGGAYLFTYDGNSWRDENGKIIKIDAYGISVTGTPVAGDHVAVTETTTPLTFDIIGIDHDTPADTTKTHSMTLQLHDLWSSPMVYDAVEAAWYIDEETYPAGLAAGTYCFTLPSGYDTSYGGGSTFNFTLTKAVPVGGQICFPWSYNTQASACKITTYSTVGAAAALETVSVVEGEDGTAMPSLSETAVTSNTNCVHRMRYASNNWSNSAIRQWLNTDGAANTWWEAKSVFDRPANADSDGFLKGIDPAFLDVVGDVTKTTQKSISDGYGLDTTTERFFLLSRAEVYAGTERRADGADGTVYEYYGAGHSDLSAPGADADSNRIKYRGGSAAYWWLRTSFYGNGNSACFVSSTGYLSRDSGFDSLGIAPACVIV